MGTSPQLPTRAGARVALVLALLAGPGAGAESLEATVHWDRRASFGLAESGVVAEVAVTAGQRVRNGDLLVSLDRRGLEARVLEARARLAGIEPDLAEASRELERARDLYDRTLLAEHDLELARNAELRLRAARDQARAGLRVRELALEHATLRAPFDALVLSVSAVPGQAVANRWRVTPLVELAAVDRLRARALVSGDRAAALEPGTGAEVVIGDARVPGTVGWVSAQAESGDAGELRYPVEVVFAPPPGQPLQVGRRVTVDLR